MHNHSAKSSNARLLSFRSKDYLIGGALGGVASVVCKNAIERRVTLNQFALSRTALLTSDLRSAEVKGNHFSLQTGQIVTNRERPTRIQAAKPTLVQTPKSEESLRVNKRYSSAKNACYSCLGPTTFWTNTSNRGSPWSGSSQGSILIMPMVTPSWSAIPCSNQRTASSRFPRLR